jgi:hypothetical protein
MPKIMPEPSKSAARACGVLSTERVIVGCLMVLNAGLLAWSAYRHSATADEPAHLAAGVLAYHEHRFDFYQVNPPLMHMIAALPVVLSSPTTAWNLLGESAPGDRPEFAAGLDFLNRNRDRAFWFVTWARWACLPVVLLGGWVCWRWSRELFGCMGGLITLLLWCVSPDILAHGSLATCDVGGACFGVLAAWMYWGWLRSPRWRDTFGVGLTLGLALLSKLTWVILIGIWPALWFVTRQCRGGLRRDLARLELCQLLTILALGCFVLHLGYGFKGAFRPLGTFEFVSDAFAGVGNRALLRTDIGVPEFKSGNRFRGTLLERLPVPVPRDYLYGIDRQRLDFEAGRLTPYLRGEHRTDGWWYWYFYALAVKEPIGLWCLAGLATWQMCRRKVDGEFANLWCPWIHAATVFGLVSSQSGLAYLRYLLPMFPFVFVGLGATSQLLELRPMWPKVTLGLSLLWGTVSSLAVYPHSLSYFNELAGGPANGHAHLIDSNFDWGQDGYYVREWLAEHPEVRPVHVVDFGWFEPTDFSSNLRHTQAGPLPFATAAEISHFGELFWPQRGWHVMPVNFLHDKSRRYNYFLNWKPFARVGYTTLIYHVTLEQANQVREQWGLPPMSAPPDDKASRFQMTSTSSTPSNE